MKRLSLLVLLIAVNAFAHATTNVRGRVLASDGKTPYPSVAVTVGNGPTVYTDRQGMFRVNGITTGSHTLVVVTSRGRQIFQIRAEAKEYTDLAPVSVP